ncbi:MAG: hypothetical protein ACI4XB_02760 [Ruminococcus sp.]|uniref:hypothetical protein n=1 Tax=Ruminococcus sp. TaxID=41978 RepID=UPI0025CFEE42|nr:hypothetical protein [Ruminococcus sp.]
MDNYKKTYFMLFSSICDTVEALEHLFENTQIEDNIKLQLQNQIDNLKFAQQRTEEMLISEAK